MTEYKVLVEFTLDPTEYRADVDGESMSMPDTLEAAKTLVQKMFEGDVDICDTRMMGDLMLLFRGRAAPSKADFRQHQQILNAIVLTVQKFIEEKPFQKITGPLSIIAQPPRLTAPFYDISIWRQAGTELTVAPEPDIILPDPLNKG